MSETWPPKADRSAVFKALLSGPKTWAELREIAGNVGSIVILAQMQEQGLLRKRGPLEPFELAPKAIEKRLREL